eukprot:4924747-Prymnesium_polylepis.1
MEALGCAAVRARPALDPHRLRTRTTDRQSMGRGRGRRRAGMRALRGGAPRSGAAGGRGQSVAGERTAAGEVAVYRAWGKRGNNQITSGLTRPIRRSVILRSRPDRTKVVRPTKQTGMEIGPDR